MIASCGHGILKTLKDLYDMKKLVLSSFVIGVALLSGCSTLNQSVVSAPVVSQVQANFDADVTVGEKISGEATQSRLFGIFNFVPSKFADGVDFGSASRVFGGSNSLKAGAAYSAVTKSGADIIVAPKYTVTRQNFFLISTEIGRASCRERVKITVVA